ncbi:MAG: hypothetical protein ACRDH5_10135 [bacterium]
MIVALVNAGFDAEAVEHPEEWAAQGGRRAVVLTANLPEDAGVIERLKLANPELSIVVLLRDAGVAGYREALVAGVSGAVPWDEHPATVIEVLRAVAVLDGGYCLLPTCVAQTLATTNHRLSLESPAISDREMKWLRMLADGATVAELALDANYSEREMFRLLHMLYERLGARTRAAALVRAARAGLLD